MDKINALFARFEPPVHSLFRVITGDERYKDVQIELEMRYQLPEWIINISIASKKKDTLD